MKVLIVSSNTLPAAPTGPVYVAGALRKAGHEVQIYENLFADDTHSNLVSTLVHFQPDVIGVSIRLVHGDLQYPAAPYGTQYIDLRPCVKQIVDVIRQQSTAQIILGGPGFNYYASDWLEYLDLEYGICGEGEESFPLLIEKLVGGGDPGCVPGSFIRHQNTGYTAPSARVKDLDNQGLPAYDLLDWNRYAAANITPAIFSKRGCAFDCSFCPYSKIEGQTYRLKSPERVLAEIHHTLQSTCSSRIMICDNSFNVPHPHAEALCRAFLTDPFEFQWGSGDLKPVGISRDFCRLMKDSGCFYLNLSIESASNSMLARMRRGYTVRQVRQSLDALCDSGIPFSASLLLGAPGETPETIAETLRVMKEYAFPLGVWVTVGVYLWTEYQDIVSEIRQSEYLDELQCLFDGPVYISPQLNESYLNNLVSELRILPGYSVQVNRSDVLIAQ
jgi:radical SAM superfamily enzyme YgiQ (UPF0313 family)